MYDRSIFSELQTQLKRKKSILMLGPRQVGKTTLLKQLTTDLQINLLNPKVRLRYETQPELLFQEIAALNPSIIPRVFIDEVQKVPSLMDPIQSLIDDKKAQFILSGSSARKLKRELDLNLLPGRVTTLRLDPLKLSEIGQQRKLNQTIMEDLLIYGAMPGWFNESNVKHKTRDLMDYVVSYLEEEIRKETEIRKLGVFSQFLRLAAIESGHVVNFSALSQQVGVSKNTIVNYFDVLFETLIAEKIEPYSLSSSRKKLIKSPKYLIFDLGVRRMAAKEGPLLLPDRMGELFEQWVGLELLHLIRSEPTWSLHFWSDPDGPEVDWVVRTDRGPVPIEVKYTENPSTKDAKHLEVFCQEHHVSAGFIICRCPRPQLISKTVTALPWSCLVNLDWLY